MSYDLTGRLIEKFPTTSVSDKFRKREFIVETQDGNFSETIKFQLTQDRCDIIDSVDIMDEVKVSFNIRGRKWEKDGSVAYFTNLDAWRIERLNAAQPKAKSNNNDAPPPTDSDMPSVLQDDDDDVPF